VNTKKKQAKENVNYNLSDSDHGDTLNVCAHIIFALSLYLIS
jgi:hypothetical protein